MMLRMKPESPESVQSQYAVLEMHQFRVGGMSCSACAMRIEKKLNMMPGVHARVNYATHKALIDAPNHMEPQLFVDAIRKMGYSATCIDQGEDASYARLSARELKLLGVRMRVAGVLAVPVIVLSMLPVFQFPFWQWISLILTTPIVFWCGWVFHRAAWLNLMQRTSTMDTLISLGVGSAYMWSLYALLFTAAGESTFQHGVTMLAMSSHGADIYFEVAAAVVFFVLLGRYIEKKSRTRAGDAVRDLLHLMPQKVRVLRDGIREEIEIAHLNEGDQFEVHPGEKIATDGVVIRGISAVDASMLTGESVPVTVGPQDSVTGGTLNTSGYLLVEAIRIGANTQLAHIVRHIEIAQSAKANIQRLADRISAIFVPIVLMLALLTLGTWMFVTHSWESAFTAAVAVLIIACPCALGLATPTALVSGTGRAAQMGIVIKGPEVFERMRTIDTIVLDKTGTVTSGNMSVIDVLITQGTTLEHVLLRVGSIEHLSEHPIAQAIAQYAQKRVGNLDHVEDFLNLAGQGVQGQVARVRVSVGTETFMRAQELVLSDALAESAQRAISKAQTVVYAGWDGQVQALFLVADSVRPTSAQAVEIFKHMQLHPILLTGDNYAVAREIARQVGIETVIAEVLPQEKLAVVEGLRSEGKSVAMIGDGINDAAALAAADVGIAMGSGSDLAIDSADMTVMRSDLMVAADALALSQKTFRIIKGNLFWAFAYNICAIPLAALGLLNPMIAGAAMAFSSAFVVLNSLRLRSFSVRRSLPEAIST